MLRRMLIPAGLSAAVALFGILTPGAVPQAQAQDVPPAAVEVDPAAPPPATAPSLTPVKAVPLEAIAQEDEELAEVIEPGAFGRDRRLAGGHAAGGGVRAAVSAVANAGAPGRDCRPWGYGQPELFYNFYAPPTCGGIGASLYTSPGPVPPVVGHTYITYQPLMPHEFLYDHHRSYHRYYDEGRGVTRTHVKYYSPPVRSAYGSVQNVFKFAR